MIETRAIVIRTEGQDAFVEAVGGSCSACGGGKSCGAGSLSEALCVRPRQFRAHNEIGARPGEEVDVTLPDGALLRTALALYAFPLVLLFAGALIGSAWAGAAWTDAGSAANDGGAALGALAGLALGFLIVAVRGRRGATAIIRRGGNAASL